MVTRLDKFYEEHPALKDLDQDTVLEQLHQFGYGNVPYDDFVRQMRSSMPTAIQRLEEGGFPESETGLRPSDMPEPDTLPMMGRAAARGFAEAASGGISTLLRPVTKGMEAVTGSPKFEQIRKNVKTGIRELVAPPQPRTPGQALGSTAMGIVGATPIGLAEFEAGGLPYAFMHGFESYEDIREATKTDSPAWRAWADAGIETVLRRFWGSQVLRGYGPVIRGGVFGTGQAAADTAEGRDWKSSAMDSFLAFATGALARSGPKAQRRLNAAKEANAGGDMDAAMHHANQLMHENPALPGAIANAADHPGPIYPDPSGDFLHSANARLEVHDPPLGGGRDEAGALPRPGDVPPTPSAGGLPPPSEEPFDAGRPGLPLGGKGPPQIGQEKRPQLPPPAWSKDKDIAAMPRHDEGEPPVTPEPPPAQGPVKPKPKGPAARDPRTFHLFEFLAKKGGLAPHPELDYIFGNKNPFIPGFGRLIRRNGIPLDHARRVAIEDRYLHDPGELSGGESETTVNDLLEKLRDQHHGRKQYPQGYEPPERVQEREQRIHEMGSHLDSEMEAVGISPLLPDDPLRARVVEMMDKEGVQDPLEAYERAVMEGAHADEEAGHVEPHEEDIPGWHIPDESGATPETSPSTALVARTTLPRAGSAPRAVSGADRAPTGPEQAQIGGGGGRGRLPPHATEGEWRDDPRRRLGFDNDIPGRGQPHWDETELPLVPGKGGWKEAFKRGFSRLRTELARKDKANAYARRQIEWGEELFHGVSGDDRSRMMTNVMRGLDPLDGMAFSDNHSKQLRDWWSGVKDYFENQHLGETLGAEIEYEWKENYFPLQWKGKASEAPRYGGGGGNFFTKHKTFQDVQAGLDAGYELVTNNPAVLSMIRAEAGNMAIARVLALRGLVKDGLAIRVDEVNRRIKVQQSMPKESRTDPKWAEKPSELSGYETVNVGGHQYYVHPRVKAWLQNGYGIERRAISQIFGMNPEGRAAAIGESLYQGWMKLKNISVFSTLSLSGFHALHVTGIDSAQPFAAALTSTANKGMSFESFLKSLRDYKIADREAYGARVAEQFGKPMHELSPVDQMDQNLLLAGGQTPQQPGWMEINMARDFRRLLGDRIPQLHEALDKNGASLLSEMWQTGPQYAKAAALTIGKAFEELQGPMFRHWIPSLKTSAYLFQAKTWLLSHPELHDNSLESATKIREGLTKISREMDNRYGEMQYDKEMWNQLLRRSLMATFLSTGWNLGFVRSFGGALGKDLPTNLWHGVQRMRGKPVEGAELSNKIVYLGAYAAIATFLGGTMTFLNTGDIPDTRDLFYPRMPDGSRNNTMFLTREFPAMYYHMMNAPSVPAGVADILKNKLAPSVTRMLEVVSNSDYFGNQVYDPNGDFFSQTAQKFKHLMVQAPISFQQFAKDPEDPQKGWLGVGGFNPAPQYATDTPTGAAIKRAYSSEFSNKTEFAEVPRMQAQRDLASTYRQFLDKGDEERRTKTLEQEKAYIEKYPHYAGRMGQNMRNWFRPPLLGRFSRLGRETQQAIFDKATLGEKSWLQFGLRVDMRSKNKVMPSLEQFQQFTPEDQENFLKVVPSNKEVYAEHAQPSVQAKYKIWKRGLGIAPEPADANLEGAEP